MVYQKTNWTNGMLISSDRLNNIEDGVDILSYEFYYRGVNVKWFGAVGDGVTDDTNAFNLAYQDALNKKINKIYIPAGSYVVNFKNMLIKNFEIEGAGRDQTFLIQQSIDPLFDVKSFSKIHNLAITNLNRTTTTSIVVKNSDAITSYYNVRLENLAFKGSEDVGFQSGQWVYTPILFDLNNKGLWDVRIDDVEIEWADKGISVDTTNGGWFTGSLFNNIVVKGFSTFAVGLIPSNNTLRQISQNVFSDLKAEVLYKTALNAIGFVVSGQGNDFNNLNLFNDGAYSGKAIQIKNYSPSTTYAKPGWGDGNTFENTFNGGTIEGIVDDPDGLIDFQNFNDVRLLTKDADGVPVMTKMTSVLHANLLSRSTVSKLLSEQFILTSNKGTTATSGIDKNGKYVEISNTTDENYQYMPFPDSDNTMGTLIGKEFTVGVKYKKVSGTGIKLGTVRFDEQFYPNSPKFKFDNTVLNREVTEATWVFPANSDFFTPLIPKARRFDGIYFQIAANSTVRIYDAFLTVGSLSSSYKLSKVETSNRISDTGGRNMISGANDSIVATNLSNSASITKSFAVDVNLLNFQQRRNIVISSDIKVENLNSNSITSRLSVYTELTVTYSDGTVKGYNFGVGAVNSSLIVDRYWHYFQLPNKVVSSAILTINVSANVSASYVYIGNPQIERGLVAHDYMKYYA